MAALLNRERICWSVQGSLTHGFAVEFASKEGRDDYVPKDPVHQAFVKSIDGKVEGFRILDYEPGTY